MRLESAVLDKSEVSSASCSTTSFHSPKEPHLHQILLLRSVQVRRIWSRLLSDANYGVGAKRAIGYVGQVQCILGASSESLHSAEKDAT